MNERIPLLPMTPVPPARYRTPELQAAIKKVVVALGPKQAQTPPPLPQPEQAQTLPPIMSVETMQRVMDVLDESRAHSEQMQRKLAEARIQILALKLALALASPPAASTADPAKP